MAGTGTCHCAGGCTQAENETSHHILARIVVAAVLWAAAWAVKPGWAELACFIGAYLVCGWDVLAKAARNLWHKEFLDENFLMSLATLGAFAVGELPEAVGVMWFYQIGEFFMDRALHRSRRNVRALMDLTPAVVHVQAGSQWVDVAPAQVQPGQVILVKAGERVALDGRVRQGKSDLDTSALTGESVPVPAGPGQEIWAGVIVLGGALELEVLRPFTDSAVAKILELVEHAYTKKTRAERFITRFARWYTPLVVLAALLTAFVPPLVLPGASLHTWVYRALIFLVISCPCALVLSVPLGFFGGIGAAARRGILVKGSGSLEALAKAQIMVFDKTGTLTHGQFTVTDIRPQNGFTRGQLLELAAYAESASTHPLARAICRAYAHAIDSTRLTSRREEAGRGVWAVVDGKEIFAGKAPQAQAAGTSVRVTVDGVLAGDIYLADEAKAEARAALAELKQLGVRQTVMLTGDVPATAAAVAAQTGIDVFYASLLPGEKVTRVEQLLAAKDPGRTLLAAGDGINDAPVLARADVGIAMGALGSDAAVEAADVVLVDDKLSKIAQGIRLGRFTLKIVRQNIVFALGVKAVVMALGVLGTATLWEAVFADVGVAVLCVANSLRPLYLKD